MSVNSTASILVGFNNRIVWIRVVGKGSFHCSTSLKDFAREMINRGHREFIMDLKECPVMDSTFMGTLAGIALRLRDVGQGNLHVININERNLDLLQGLGLDQLFSIDTSGVEDQPDEPMAAPASQEQRDRESTSKTMLEAHEALVKADPTNLTKFKDVLEYLRQDLDEPGSD